MNIPDSALVKDENSGARQIINLEIVEPDDVPLRTKTRLIKKSKAVISGAQTKDVEILKQLQAEESIKVPYFDRR